MTISATTIPPAPHRPAQQSRQPPPRAAFAARAPADRPPASTWWPERGHRAAALPGEAYQPALFAERPAVRSAVPAVGRAPRPPRRGTPVRVSRIAALPDRALPDVRRWCVSFGLALMEAMAGHRALAQLVRYVSEDVQATVQLAARRAPTGDPERISVSSARIQVLSPRTVEACVHALHGHRHTLVAFRLAAAGDKWLCTDIDVLAGAVTIRSGSR